MPPLPELEEDFLMDENSMAHCVIGILIRDDETEEDIKTNLINLFQAYPNVNTLSLNGVDLSDLDVCILCSAIFHSPSIKHLYLQNNEFGDPGLEWVTWLVQHTQTLNIHKHSTHWM